MSTTVLVSLILLCSSIGTNSSDIGTLRSFLSGRISYAFKFSGPSVVTDTACSASVVCIYQACRALANGDCTAAIAGGVNVISSPDVRFFFILYQLVLTDFPR